MQQNYKRLGDYIRLVNVRNHDDSVKELLGINIDKFFMPSVANIVGTDLSKYKLVTKNQFACNRMHVGRDYRIPIAKSDSETPFIVSPAYDVFEIINEDILTPDYLMLWFKRKEFDRNAWFYTDADVRGGLNWNALINMKFPLPSLEKQKGIVAEYQTVEQRIRLNNALCQKLEDTAQTIYRQWFEEFEFPVRRHCDERGTSDEAIPQVAEPESSYGEIAALPLAMKGYKSSGGKMVYSEELGKEIPEGWKVGKLGEVFETIGGGTPSTEIDEYWNGDIIWYSPTDVTRNNSIYSNNSEKKITDLGLKSSSAKLLPAKTLLMTSRATIGAMIINEIPAATNQGFISIIPTKQFNSEFIYLWIQERQSEILNKASGSTFLEISKSEFRNFDFIIPTERILNEFEKLNMYIFNKIKSTNKQTQKLEELKSLLLGKMAVIKKYLV